MSAGLPNEQFQQFDPNTYRPAPAPRRSSVGKWLLGIFLVFFGMFMLGGILCVAGVYYVATNIDKWVVGLGREAIVAMVNEASISATEKTEVIAQVDRVVTAYKERKIDQHDLEKALNELNEAPALKVLSLYGLDDLFLTSSSLTEEEIAAGRRSYQRALRGVYEGKFSEEDLYAVLPIDADEKDGGQNGDDVGENIRLVNNNGAQAAGDDEIRESLVKLKVMADNAGIPNEAFQLDIGDEVRKVVDRLLEGKEGK